MSDQETPYSGETGSDTTPYSPTTAGEEAQTSAEQDRAEASRTTREFGRNSAGDPTMYATDIEMLTNQYNLTRPEAESLWNRSIKGGEDTDTVVGELKNSRVHYRQAYEQTPDIASTLAVADINRARVEAQAEKTDEGTDTSTAANAPTTDATQPEAGPYGPYAEYDTVSIPAEEVAQQSGTPIEQVREDADSGVLNLDVNVEGAVK